MSMDEIFKITGAILTSVGGAAVIIFALSSWLSKVWANRILEKDRLAYSLEVERIKNQLHADTEKHRFIFSLYFEGQFKLYNELWSSLSELQNNVEELWAEANNNNFRRFELALSRAKKQIRSSALLIERHHYNEIMEVIDTLENYQSGKEGLIDKRRRCENISSCSVQEIIEKNRHNREKINIFVEYMLVEMRRQISCNSRDPT